MNFKIVKAFGTGVSGICVLYGSVGAVLRNVDNDILTKTVVIEVPSSSVNDTSYKDSLYSDYPPEQESIAESQIESSQSEIPPPYLSGHSRKGWHQEWRAGGGTTDSATSSTDESSNANSDDASSQTLQASGDDSAEKQAIAPAPSTSDTTENTPTLSQFLSNLHCGACGRNCSLLNPRCRKGKSKAESQTSAYYAQYA